MDENVKNEEENKRFLPIDPRPCPVCSHIHTERLLVFRQRLRTDYPSYTPTRADDARGRKYVLYENNIASTVG